MSYLTWIKDSEIELIVKAVLDKGIDRKKLAKTKFNENVIDPFGALFESAAFDLDHKTWKRLEVTRQCQKTLQNHVGELHQKILGKVKDWKDLGVGSVVDLECDKRNIIAEVKNKYNTVTGGKLAEQYYSLERLVMLKSSKHKEYTAYFVNIIPKKPIRTDITFEPSDKDKGAKCAANSLIRVIDGASFYTLVTGDKDALSDFYQQLPVIIEKVFTKYYEVKGFKLADKKKFSKYFDFAYT